METKQETKEGNLKEESNLDKTEALDKEPVKLDALLNTFEPKPWTVDNKIQLPQFNKRNPPFCTVIASTRLNR